MTLLFNLFTFSTAFSQNYLEVLNPFNFWDTYAWDPQGSHCYITDHKRVNVGVDTVVNGLTYKRFQRRKILSSNYNCPPYAVDTIVEVDNLILREDTVLKRVYYFNGGQSDELLYDFSLNIGDTLQSFASTFGLPIILIDIDTVVYSDMIARRRFKFDHWSNPEYTEGIGGGTGIGYPIMQGIGTSGVLECFHSAGLDLTGVCNQNVVQIREPQNSQFLIYPNPTAGNFLTLSQKANDVIIYDLNGRPLIRAEIVDFIDLTDIPTGFYYLSARINSKTIFKRFVKTGSEN